MQLIARDNDDCGVPGQSSAGCGNCARPIKASHVSLTVLLIYF